MEIKPSWAWLWILPNVFLVFWTLSRAYAYFFLTIEQDIVGFRSDMMPKPVPEIVVEGFTKYAAIPLAVGVKWYLTRAHIVTAGLLGFMMSIQLTTYIRNKYLSFHRFVGKLTIPLMIIHYVIFLYISLVLGKVQVGFWTGIYTDVSLVISLISYPLGLYFIKVKNIEAHRKCMLITAGCMYMIPLQRFLWMNMSTNAIFGPYTSWEQYREVVLSTSSLIGMIGSLGVAAYFAMKNEKYLPKEKSEKNA